MNHDRTKGNVKTKSVTDFYFFEVVYDNNWRAKFCVIGTANLPVKATYEYLHEKMNGFQKAESDNRRKLRQDYQKVRKFISKNNVFLIEFYTYQTRGMIKEHISSKKETIFTELWTNQDISLDWDYIENYSFNDLTFPCAMCGQLSFEKCVTMTDGTPTDRIHKSRKTPNSTPILIGKNRTRGGCYFFFQDKVYFAESSDGLLTFLSQNLASNDGIRVREQIPDKVQIFVWNRDGGKCIKCGTNENLAFDHIIPFSKGGSNTKRNLQILCDSCNSKKGNKIGGIE